MSGLLDLINSPMGKQLISGVAKETGQPENKTADILSMAMPLLVEAMKKNASDPQGAAGLMGALNSKHNGSIFGLKTRRGRYSGPRPGKQTTRGGKRAQQTNGGRQQRYL